MRKKNAQNELYIPNEIRRITGNQKFVYNHTGMSASKVLIFPAYVLKIQPQSPETENEKEIAAWIADKKKERKEGLPIPEIKAYVTENKTAYTLMTKINGNMLCDQEYMKHPKQLIGLVAEGLKLLWRIDIRNCPCGVSPLEKRLKEARRNVENATVALELAEEDTFGPSGFANPGELLHWLENNRPKEDPVLTHGDFCLPNILAEHGHISGFIDTGKMGPADKWQDIAIVLRSLKHNFAGKYTGGKSYPGYDPQMLLDELGIEMDEEKNRYYRLLDELF